MLDRDYQDIISGAILICLGAFVAYYASAHYGMGTIRVIGPGAFPVGLGCLLVGIGCLVVVPALRRRARVSRLSVEWWPLATVMGGIAAFAVTVRTLGMVPAIVLLTVIVSYADGRLGLVRSLVLAAALSVIAVVIFRLLLGTPFPMYRWPF